VVRNLLTAILATLATLGALEVAVRIVPRRENPGRVHYASRSNLFRLDPDLIYALRPGARGELRTREFREIDEINAAGLRGRDVGPKGRGVQRVIAVGDSFTFGTGVAAADSYPEALERELRERGVPVEVVNAGVPGYGADQTYRWVRLRAREYAPDAIVFGVHTSDLRDGADFPLYDVRDGRLVALDARRTWIYLQGDLLVRAPGWLHRSALFRWTVEQMRGKDPFGLRPPLDREDVAVWVGDKIRREILDLAALGRAEGFRFAVLLMPAKEHLARAAPNLYDGLTTGVPTLDALAAMRADEPHVGRLFYREDMHLTVAGYRRLAKVVADFLLAEGVVTNAEANRL
jgi:lysophospholipase L1-like esterase